MEDLNSWLMRFKDFECLLNQILPNVEYNGRKRKTKALKRLAARLTKQMSLVQSARRGREYWAHNKLKDGR